MTQFDPHEIFIREEAVALSDVDVKQRLIDLVAVPWDQEAEVPWRGQMWNEVFRRGAFDGLGDHAGRVLVTRDHTPDGRGDPVGKLVFTDPKHSDGLFTRAKIGKTVKGDETLALAEEGILLPSVGYRIKSADDVRLNRRTRLREVMRAFLDHVSLVPYPAYAGAQILAVREGQLRPGEAMPHSGAIDEAYNDPAYQAAVNRLNSSRA